MRTQRHAVRVEWGDCDPAGIVFYPNYYRWMDQATLHLFDAINLGWSALREKYGAPGLPLISTHADYKSPGYFGDLLDVDVTVSELGTKSLTVTHIISRNDIVLVEGWEKRIWSRGDPAGGRGITPVAIPDDVRALLS